jgi:hypothetical protein
MDMAKEAGMCAFMGDLLETDQVGLQHIEPSSLQKRQVSAAFSKALSLAG